MAINWAQVDLSEYLVANAAGEMVIYCTNVDSTNDPAQDLEDLLRRPGQSLVQQIEQIDATWTISTQMQGHQYRFEPNGIITSVIGICYPLVKHVLLIYTKMDPSQASS